MSSGRNWKESTSGVQQAREGPGTFIPEAGAESVTPPERALMHVYRALGLTYEEIGSRVDRDVETVRAIVTDARERVSDGEDPLDVYADVTGAAMLVAPRDDGGDDA